MTGRARVHTSPVASPARFPFKVAAITGTLSDPAGLQPRPRICGLGYLCEAYQAEDGTSDSGALSNRSTCTRRWAATSRPRRDASASATRSSPPAASRRCARADTSSPQLPPSVRMCMRRYGSWRPTRPVTPRGMGRGRCSRKLVSRPASAAAKHCAGAKTRRPRSERLRS